MIGPGYTCHFWVAFGPVTECHHLHWSLLYKTSVLSIPYSTPSALCDWLSWIIQITISRRMLRLVLYHHYSNVWVSWHFMIGLEVAMHRWLVLYRCRPVRCTVQCSKWFVQYQNLSRKASCPSNSEIMSSWKTGGGAPQNAGSSFSETCHSLWAICWRFYPAP